MYSFNSHTLKKTFCSIPAFETRVEALYNDLILVHGLRNYRKNVASIDFPWMVIFMKSFFAAQSNPH